MIKVLKTSVGWSPCSKAQVAALGLTVILKAQFQSPTRFQKQPKHFQACRHCRGQRNRMTGVTSQIPKREDASKTALPSGNIVKVCTCFLLFHGGFLVFLLEDALINRKEVKCTAQLRKQIPGSITTSTQDEGRTCTIQAEIRPSGPNWDGQKTPSAITYEQEDGGIEGGGASSNSFRSCRRHNLSRVCL